MSEEEEKPRKPHLWKKGESGNPGGMPKEVAIRIRKNAVRATLIRERLLETIENQLDTVEEMARVDSTGSELELRHAINSRVLRVLTPEVNRILTDSENRGMGSPKQSVDVADRRHRTPDEYTDEELAKIAAGDFEEVEVEGEPD